MSNLDKLARELKSLIAESDNRKPKPYDTDAEVMRVAGDTLWVHIPGGVEETPIKKTINAIPGDKIKVHIANGSAWISGNETAPPTDDRTAIHATNIAVEANGKAMDAQKASKEAILYAGVAKEAAGKAQESATSAEELAGDAQISANNAASYANKAFSHMSIVEDIVGVLDLIAKDGEYAPTLDETVIEGKWYFTRSGTSPNYEYSLVPNPQRIEYALTVDTSIVEGKTYYERTGTGTEEDPYVYSAVAEPVIEDIGTYYECLFYELRGIKESIQNYVSSHLVLLNDGLHLRTSGTNAEIWISDNGVVIKDANGTPIGQYGGNAVIGNPTGFHIEIDADELAFYHGARDADKTNRVAYVSGQELYITKSVVLQQMDLGIPQFEGGLGQWSWKVHENANGKNNLHLKWMG